MTDIISKVLDLVKKILDALKEGKASAIIEYINEFFAAIGSTPVEKE